MTIAATLAVALTPGTNVVKTLEKTVIEVIVSTQETADKLLMIVWTSGNPTELNQGTVSIL
jgi:hypothetical protein